MITTIGIFHAGLTVANLDRSIEFYSGLLGMTVVHRQMGDNDYTRTLVGIPDAILKAAFLRFNTSEPGLSGHVLELIEYLQPYGTAIKTRPCDPGAAHLAFITPDCIGLYEQLVPRGVKFVNRPVVITAGINKGGVGCYLRDPDGFILEFVQPPAWRLEGRPPPST